MIEPSDFDDVLVTLPTAYGDLEVPLSEWARRGPGPRDLMTISSARRQSTGEPVSLDEIPLEYHNTRTTRQMQREGLLPTPWGPPPDDPPAPSLANLPPEVADEIRRLRGYES